MKLPKNLIAKYGISKKAWSVFRGQKRGGSSSMAKKGKKQYNFMKKSSGSKGIMWTLLGAALYGAMRSPAANAISGLTGKLPFGQLNDEAGMIGLALLGKRFAGSGGLVGGVANAAIMVEGARIGETLASGTALSGLGMSGGGQPMQTNVYGAGQNVYA